MNSPRAWAIIAASSARSTGFGASLRCSTLQHHTSPRVKRREDLHEKGPVPCQDPSLPVRATAERPGWSATEAVTVGRENADGRSRFHLACSRFGTRFSMPNWYCPVFDSQWQSEIGKVLDFAIAK